MRGGWIVCCAFLACAGERSSDGNRSVVADVGKMSIYADDLKREFQRHRLDDEEGLPPAADLSLQKKTLLEDLINRRLLLQEAERKGVVVGTDEVEAQLLRLRGGYKESEFEELLKTKDFTIAELKVTLRDSLVMRKYLRNHVFARLAVTDQEIDRFLQDHPEMFLAKEQVRARHIVVKTADKAKEVLDEIKKGLLFEEAAIKYSLSPEGKSGGDLGFFARGQMPKVFDEVFGLKVGELSPVMASDYGFHIFKVLEHRPEGLRPNDELRKEVERQLRIDKELEAQKAKIQELRLAVAVVIHESVLDKVR